MKLKLELTDEHLKMIPFFFIETDDDKDISINRYSKLIEMSNRILEDMCLILGYQDKAIPNTEDDADGRAFDDEIEKHMLDVYHYVEDNLYLIETLIHQFVVKGGLTQGTYVCNDNDMIWEKVD